MRIQMNGIECTIRETKAGGRVVTAETPERTVRKYTHPCRANSWNRFESDVVAVVTAARGELPKAKVEIRA